MSSGRQRKIPGELLIDDILDFEKKSGRAYYPIPQDLHPSRLGVVMRNLGPVEKPPSDPFERHVRASISIPSQGVKPGRKKDVEGAQEAEEAVNINICIVFHLVVLVILILMGVLQVLNLVIGLIPWLFYIVELLNLILLIVVMAIGAVSVYGTCDDYGSSVRWWAFYGLVGGQLSCFCLSLLLLLANLVIGIIPYAFYIVEFINLGLFFVTCLLSVATLIVLCLLKNV